jgi:hypothetical protein
MKKPNDAANRKKQTESEALSWLRLMVPETSELTDDEIRERYADELKFWKKSLKKPLPEPTLGAEDIIAPLEIPGPTFQQWMNRGLVPFEVVGRGKRTYRRFRAAHFVHIAIMVALWRQGIEPSVANQMVEVVKEAIPASTKFKNKVAGPLSSLPGEFGKVFRNTLNQAWWLSLAETKEFKQGAGFLAIYRKDEGYWGRCVGPKANLNTVFENAGTSACFVVDLWPIMKQTSDAWRRFRE